MEIGQKQNQRWARVSEVGRDDRISCADPLHPPSYPRSPVPTSSGPFCHFVRAGERALSATEKTKPAAVAAGFLFVDLPVQFSNLFWMDIRQFVCLGDIGYI